MARRRKKTHRVRKAILTLLLIFIMTTAICGVAFAWYIHSYINPAIEALDLNALNLNMTSVIYAEDPTTGAYVEYEKLHAPGENRIWADLEDIPTYMGQAFIAIEDQRFYSHHGVDWKRTLGATLSWIGGNDSYGGSTITQQLIKNLTNDKDYSVRRKINEIFRALALEKSVDGNKDRILEMYMNLVPFGNNACGVQAAAHTYFNKDVKELTLAECAAIAGITNAPTKLNPFNHPENTKARQEIILDQMQKQGMITQAECDAAKAQELHYERPADEIDINEPYSYFTDTIIEDVTNDLIEQKGYSQQLANNMVLMGGLQIYATIDQTVQNTMDEVYQNDDNFPKLTHKNQTNGQTERPESAMIVTKPGGAIVGIVGGRGEKMVSRGLNRATQSKRQPGSSIKPLAVYGPAMDAGLITPYTGMVDEPFKELNGKAWPRNDNNQYTGSVILKNAVARSINTIAVKTLDLLTPEKSFEFLTEKLGMGNSLVTTRTLESGSVVGDIGYAQLALGGLTDGVTVREMAGGYGIFINGGDFIKPYTYYSVKDYKGNTLLSNEEPERVHAFENEKTTYYMNETLQGVTTSGGTAASAKISGMGTAGKTGTTTANVDRWFCGYTPYYVGACWVGFDNNYKLNGLRGNPATNLWKAVMTQIHKRLPDASFPKPGDGFTSVRYCTKTGLLPVDGCETAVGHYYKGDAPKEKCPGHVSTQAPETGISPDLIDPEAVKNADGSYTNPDGTILHPDGSITKPDGTVIKPDGTTVNPDGGTAQPTTPDNGAVTTPGDTTTGGGNTGGSTGENAGGNTGNNNTGENTGGGNNTGGNTAPPDPGETPSGGGATTPEPPPAETPAVPSDQPVDPEAG